MAGEDDLHDALSSLSPSDIALDTSGRLIITNAQAADRIAKLVGPLAVAPRLESQNLACCENAAKCKTTAMTAEDADTLASVADRFLRTAAPRVDNG